MQEPLKAIEQNFLILDSPTSSQVIASLSVTAGSPDIQKFRESLAQAIVEFPRSRFALKDAGAESSSDQAWEEDASFSLEHHLRVHEFPLAKNLDELLLQASRLFSEGLDFSRPLWCFHVLSSPNCQEGISLFLIHHAYSDGGGGMEFVHAVCDPRRRGQSVRDSGRQRVSVIRQRPPRETGPWSGKTKFIASMKRIIEDWGIRRDEFPYHGVNSPVRSIHLLNLSAERARTIKEALDVSLNDVFLAYVAGALHKLAKGKNFAASGRVFIPFNLRSRSARKDFGNCLSAVPISLHAQLEDPVQSVIEIHEETNHLKEKGAFGSFGLLGQIAAIFPKRLRQRLLLSACRRGNFICTNVPSSRQQLAIGGALVLANYGCAALLPEQGMSIGFMSYFDRVCISLVRDPAIGPEPSELFSAFQLAEEELFQRILAALPDEDQLKVAKYGS